MFNNDPLQKNNVKISGNPDASQTMIFGNGFGTDTTAWRKITPAFEHDFRIINYDNVGGGQSDPAAFNQSRYEKLLSYANDLINICDVLKIKDAIYVGHSVSGMVGLLATRKSPALFSRLVFMNASPRYLNDAAANYIGGFEKQDLLELYRLMASNYYAWAKGFAAHAMGNPDKPQLADEFARTLSEVRPDVAVAVAKAIFESDHRADLKDFTHPSLVIQSSKDIAVPVSVGHYLKTNMVNSRLQIIPADGHFPHIAFPELIVNALKSYLSSN